MEQEQIIKLQMIEQESTQLQQQLQLIEHNSGELLELSKGLGEINKTKEEDIFVNLGKRIYLPVKLRERNLLVDVGKGNFARKSFKEVEEIIQDQLKKLENAKNEIIERIGAIQSEMDFIIEEIGEDKRIKNE